MYRELLNEFLKIANEVSDEELEALSNATLIGLDKMADVECDNLMKFAEEVEELSKEAEDDEDKVKAVGAGLALAGGIAAGIAGAKGINKLKAKMPQWKQQRFDAKRTKAARNFEAAEKSYRGATIDAHNHAAKHGFTANDADDMKRLGLKEQGSTNYTGGRGEGVTNYTGGKGEGLSKRDAKKVENRVNQDLEDKSQIANDMKTLERADWINKNKAMLLAGAGGTALLANQAIQSKKKDAELAGAYNMGVRR